MSTDFQLMEKKQTQCFCLSFHTYEFSTCILNWNKLLSNYSQSLSHVQLFATPWTAACQASLSITNSWCLLKLMSIKSVMNSPGKNTGLTFPPPGDLSNTGIKPRFPALQVDSLPAEPPGKTNSRQVRAISSVQLLSHVWLFATPWNTACQASLSITNSWNLLKLMPIELVMPSDHLILCCPLLLLLSVFPRITIFPNESAVGIGAKVLGIQLYRQSFQCILKTDFLYYLLIWSPWSPSDSWVFSNTTVKVCCCCCC